MTTERRQENKFIVYTDIVGHTKMLGRLGVAFKPIRERHDELFQLAVRAHGDNAVVKGSGDGFYAATDSVDDAIEIALSFRRALAHEDWNRLLPEAKRTPDNHIRSRVGIHSGSVRVQFENGVGVDFDGAPRNIAEKVMSKAQGNQVLVSRQVRDQGQLNFRRNAEVEWKRFGEYKLRDVADTVEIWGLGESELGVGAAPVQDPEHRVIIFAVIHDYSTIVEQAGPGFEALKDAWDTAFQKAVDAHSKDTFVKRLPDGSLAAFRNAIDAVRAARDFRRMWKAEMKTALHRAEPKTALDCGLVTFSYENNRAVDVRDQPVNMAAKVAKTGLTAPWQFILTRPVREDAFANMPERDEFKWVCIGRKAVPGEPEPVELWDFQDVQVKREDRSVVWVDFAHIREDLKNRRDVYIKCVSRVDQMLGEVLAKRAEEAWTLSPDAARIAAFRDPVEAVQAALDLRERAVAENWGTLFQSRGKGWHPLKIAVHTGPVRMTSEDGQRKDLKGAPVEGIRSLLGACEMGSTLVSRELKEAVARHLPDTQVRWTKVDVPAVEDAAVEGFELLAKQKGVWERLTGPQRIAAVAGAAAVLIGGGVALPLIMRGGGGGGGAAPTAAGESRPWNDVYQEFSGEVGRLKGVDPEFEPLAKLLTSTVARLLTNEITVSPGTQRAVAEVRELLADVARRPEDRTYDLAELATVHASGLTALKDSAGLAQWLADVRTKTQRPMLPDTRPVFYRRIAGFRSDLELAKVGPNPPKNLAELHADLEKVGGMLAEVANLRWVSGNEDRIKAAVVRANTAAQELAARIAKAVDESSGGGAEESVARLPAPIQATLTDLASQANEDLRPIVLAINAGVRQRHKDLVSAGTPAEQVEKSLADILKPVRAALDDQAYYETRLFAAEQAPKPGELPLDRLAGLFGEAIKPYRVLNERRGTVVNTVWRRRIDDEMGLLHSKLKAKPPESVAAAAEALRKAVETFPDERELPWIERNKKAVADARKGVEDRFAALAAVIEEENKKVGPAPVVVAELGPIPEELVAPAAKLAADADPVIAGVGRAARAMLEASWEDARRLRRSSADARAILEPALRALRQLVDARAKLDAAALSADRAAIGEPTPGTLDVWLGRIGQYARIADADPRDESERRLSALRSALVGEEDGKIPETDVPREFRDAQSELRSIAKADYPWIEKNREVVAARATQLAKSLVAGGPVEAALRRAVTERSAFAAIDRARRDLDKLAQENPVSPAAEPEAFAAWDGARRRALESRNADNLDTVKAAADTLRQAKASLSGIVSRMALPEIPGDRRWAASIQTTAKARRGAAISAALAPGADAARIAKEYGEFAASCVAFVSRWAAVEDAFAGVSQLDTEIPALNNAKLGMVIDDLLKHPLLEGREADTGVKDALRPLTQRARLLRKVADLDLRRQNAFDQLVDIVDDPDAELETRVAVWNTMKFEAFADSASWLDHHKRVFRRVEADLERMPDKARAAKFREFLAGDKARRWMMHTARLGGFDAIDRAMRERDAFAVTDEVLAAAPAPVRWNIAVWRIDRARQRNDEDGARQAIATLTGDQSLRQDLGATPRPAAFLSALASLGASSGGAGPGSVSPAAMGPGRDGWEFVPGESRGDTLVYQMKQPAGGWAIPGKSPPKLAFKAVSANGETSYLATTELSVQTVIEHLRALGLEGSLITLFGNTQREGPFAWGLQGGRLLVGFEGETGANTRAGWVKLGGGLKVEEYFGQAAPSPPEGDMPFQYVSFPTAVFLARTLNCRLPTTAEWSAALAGDGGVGDLSKRNLRDQSYRRQFELVKAASGKTVGFTDPDKDVYGLSRAGKERFQASDDGVVFFAPVDQDPGGRAYKHLVGNVAEVTCDKPREMEALDPRSMPVAEAFVKAPANAQAFALVGDSALSEARDAAAIVNEPRRPTVAAAQRIMLGRGWSDVGLRLAFSPSAFKPTQGPEEVAFLVRLRQAFDQAPPYLAPSGG